MPRVTVKVEVPANVADLTALMQKIVDQDAALNTAAPGSSPVNPKDITTMKAILAKVNPDLDLISKYQPQVDAAVQRTESALGLADGQTVRTDGTGLFLVTKVRDTLLGEYKGNEKELEGFGYDVALGSAPTGKKAAATKKPA